MRKQVVEVSLYPSEVEKLNARAKRNGVPRSDYVRQMILRHFAREDSDEFAESDKLTDENISLL